MNQMTDLDLVRRGEALQELAKECRRDMQKRWPEVNFDADKWKIKSLYKTTMVDVRFGSLIQNFEACDAGYVLAARCLVARTALDGKIKTTRTLTNAWRLLHGQAVPLAALRRHHLDEVEKKIVSSSTPASAKTDAANLSHLGRTIDVLARLGVVGHLAWSPSAESRAKLSQMSLQHEKCFRAKKTGEILDRQIEGFSDATRAMLSEDKRLSVMDRSAIAASNILMCAPSRINEPLCMRVGDRYTIEDYAQRPATDDSSRIFKAHQLMLMKGSKGADWSGKPILNFMIGLSDTCWNVLLKLGQRSRMLLKHYEQEPNRLYLPQELEHLRGKPVTKGALWQIVNVTSREPTRADLMGAHSGVWGTIVKRQEESGITQQLMIDNPRTHRSDGQRNSFSKIPALPWDVVEVYMLERVQERMVSMRRITDENSYQGTLSEMLMLVDAEYTPYLPQAWNDDSIRMRLKTTPTSARQGRTSSVFIKLGLKMTLGAELVDCYLEPHDTRRWLTTKALEARERVSDVLINKWANRLSLSQLPAYDERSDESKATQAALPVPRELEAITTGLKELEGLEKEYGLSTEVVVAHGDGLAVTSVDAVLQATEGRPVARTGNQIIVLYPTRFGICLHQHHETPCTYYGGCSKGCDESVAVKGHLPTNEEWRKRNDLNNRSIVNQLQALITARNRGVADEPAMLDAHLLTLIKGLDAQAMADDLISRFHEIKDQIRDAHFRHELEAAFVARGVVEQLDSESVSSGALIKYHSPSRHASPGHERAIEAQLGGREEMKERERLFYQQHPELAPSTLGLQDERHLLEDDSNDADDADEQAA